MARKEENKETPVFQGMLEGLENAIQWRVNTRDDTKTIYRPVNEQYFEPISKAEAKMEIREVFRYATPGTIAALCDALLEDSKRAIDSNVFLESRKKVIGFLNGVFDLQTGKMREYRTGDMVLDPLPWSPPFQNSLDDEDWFWRHCMAWVGEDVAHWFMSLLAYLLFIVPNGEQIWVNFFGQGANGKSVVEELLEKILGEGRTIGCDLGHINQFSGATFEGKWLVVGRDSSSNVSGAATSLIKSFSGDEKMLVQVKGGASYDVPNFGKLLVSTNQLVQSPDRTYSWYRRLIPVPFPNRFDRNDRYKRELFSHIPRIIRVLLEKAYYYRIGEVQLSKSLPAAVRKLREDTRLLNDRVAAFWELYFFKETETQEGRKRLLDPEKLDRFHQIPMTEAYEVYKWWHDTEFPDMPCEPSLRKFGGPYGAFLSTGAGEHLVYHRTNKGRLLELKP